MSWIDSVNAAREEGSFDKAMSLLNAELAKRPSDPQVFYHIACTHDSLGKEKDAAPAYEKAIELGLAGDDLKVAYLGLGSTYRCLGMYEKSEEVLRRAMELFPDFRALRIFHSLALYNLGKSAQAIGQLLRELVETSESPSIKKFQRALLFYSDKLDQTFE